MRVGGKKKEKQKKGEGQEGRLRQSDWLFLTHLDKEGAILTTTSDERYQLRPKSQSNDISLYYRYQTPGGASTEWEGAKVSGASQLPCNNSNNKRGLIPGEREVGMM